MDLRVDWDVPPRESGRSSPDVPGKEGYKRMQGDAMHTMGNEALEDRIVVCRPRRRRRLIDLGGDELGHQWCPSRRSNERS